MNDHSLLLEILYSIKKREDAFDHEKGICDNIAVFAVKKSNNMGNITIFDKAEELKNIFTDIAKKWEYFSGNSVFPIPMSKKSLKHSNYDVIDEQAIAIYLLTDDKWNMLTEYGQLREELLDFAINYIENQLNESSKDH